MNTKPSVLEFRGAMIDWDLHWGTLPLRRSFTFRVELCSPVTGMCNACEPDAPAVSSGEEK